MLLAGLIVPTLMAISMAEDGPITVRGYPWAPFISPMGEPFRSRAANDDPLARWFGGADRDADGTLTLAEMESDAARFFATLDLDGDRQILPPEFVSYEWETAPEIQVNSRWRDPRGEGPSIRKGRRSGGYDPYGLQGAARYALLNIPQPVVSADADVNRAVTPEEFRQAAALRFGLLDRNSSRGLDLAELRAQLPPTRKDQRRSKHDDPDKRVGTVVKVTD